MELHPIALRSKETAQRLRVPIATPGAANRAMWREVARQTGKVRTWQEGSRTRVALEFWLNSQRRRIYSDVDRWGHRKPLTPESAEDLLRDIQAEIRSKRSIEDALAPFLGADAPENLFGTRWHAYLQQKEREAKQRRITARHLRNIQGIERRGYLGSLLDRSIFDLDYGALEDWLAWLETEKPELSPKTRKHALDAVMASLRWLRKRKDIAEVPDPPEIPTDEHAPVLLSDETRSQILDRIQEPQRGIFLALAHMGLRPSEARALDVSAYRDDYLTISQAAKDPLVAGEIWGTKTHRVRRLPVPLELVEWIETHVSLRNRLHGKTALFRNPAGQTESLRWSPSAMKRTWDRGRSRAAIPALRGHPTLVCDTRAGTRHGPVPRPEVPRTHRPEDHRALREAGRYGPPARATHPRNRLQGKTPQENTPSFSCL